MSVYVCFAGGKYHVGYIHADGSAACVWSGGLDGLFAAAGDFCIKLGLSRGDFDIRPLVLA